MRTNHNGATKNQSLIKELVFEEKYHAFIKNNFKKLRLRKNVYFLYILLKI